MDDDDDTPVFAENFGDAQISQKLLAELHTLRQAAKREKTLSAQVRQMLLAGTPIEEGVYTAKLGSSERVNTKREAIAAILGAEETAQLWKQLPVTKISAVYVSLSNGS